MPQVGARQRRVRENDQRRGIRPDTVLAVTTGIEALAGTLLEKAVQAYPTGEVVLILDNVITHDAKVVRRWLAAHPRFRVLWLPKYSAHEHNPIERVWGLLKDTVAANRLHGSIHALVVAAERFLAETRFHAPYPAASETSPADSQAA